MSCCVAPVACTCAGSKPSAADFSAYHTLWWLRQPPQRDALLQRFPALRDWADRMAAIGHGRFEPMTPDEALHDVEGGAG